MADALCSEFERLAREFLTNRASLRHDWRDAPSRWWGARRDLVFPPHVAGVPEVFASLHEGQIVVGCGESDDDFEDFGRGFTDEQVARQAIERLIALLKLPGYVSD